MATKKSTQTPLVIACTQEEWREGVRRAIAMFRDINAVGADDLDCESDCRDGRPQENVCYGHLLGVMSARNNGVLAAFASVLTHYIGSTESAGVPDIEGCAKSIAEEMRNAIPMQIGRPSRARISMKPFAEVAHG